MKDILDCAVHAVKASGLVVKKFFLDGDYQVKIKPDGSPQTEADLKSENQLLEYLTKAFPDHGFSSEEQRQVTNSHSRYQWFIDPLEGTANFVRGIPYIAVSLCLCEDNLPILAVVYNPMTTELFTAIQSGGAKRNGKTIQPSPVVKLSESTVFIIPNQKTERRADTCRLIGALYRRSKRLLDTWAPALDCCFVACGRAEGLFVIGKKPVTADEGMLAGIFIMKEAQAVITDFRNIALSYNSKCIVVSNTSNLHRKLLKLIDKEFHA